MIEVKNVVKSFDGFHALDGLTMTVPHGAIYGLVGPNGAGKSTILRHLTGAYRQDSGEITLEGAPIYENPAVKTRMAVIPDELYYFGSASTRDMMKFYEGIYPSFDVERYQRLKEAFPEVDEKRPIRRLSKGMQKQSAFWLALSCKPDYLLLDEPVSSLDLSRQHLFLHRLGRYVEERRACCLAAIHAPELAYAYAQRVLFLHRGRVLLDAARGEPALGTLYGPGLRVDFRAGGLALGWDHQDK